MTKIPIPAPKTLCAVPMVTVIHLVPSHYHDVPAVPITVAMSNCLDLNKYLTHTTAC